MQSIILIILVLLPFQGQSEETGQSQIKLTPTSSSQSLLGAAVGSFVGFGMGHAIQGRYRTEGWKWTLAELGALGGTYAAYQSTSAPLVQNAALLTWASLRVLQAVSLWRFSYNQTAVVLRPQGPILVVSF